MGVSMEVRIHYNLLALQSFFINLISNFITVKFAETVPSHAEVVLCINTNSSDPSYNAISFLKGNQENGIEIGKYKWGGAVLGSDKKIYCIPSDSDNVLVIDPLKKALTSYPIYDDSRNSSGDRDKSGTTERERRKKNKWQGGVLVGNAIYAIPCNAESVLKIDTDASSRSPIMTELGLGVIPRGFCKWQGGFYSETDNCIYAIPEHAKGVLKIDTMTDCVSIIDLPPQ